MSQVFQVRCPKRQWSAHPGRVVGPAGSLQALPDCLSRQNGAAARSGAPAGPNTCQRTNSAAANCAWCASSGSRPESTPTPTVFRAQDENAAGRVAGAGPVRGHHRCGSFFLGADARQRRQRHGPRRKPEHANSAGGSPESITGRRENSCTRSSQQEEKGSTEEGCRSDPDGTEDQGSAADEDGGSARRQGRSSQEEEIHPARPNRAAAAQARSDPAQGSGQAAMPTTSIRAGPCWSVLPIICTGTRSITAARRAPSRAIPAAAPRPLSSCWPGRPSVFRMSKSPSSAMPCPSMPSRASAARSAPPGRQGHPRGLPRALPAPGSHHDPVRRAYP